MENSFNCQTEEEFKACFSHGYILDETILSTDKFSRTFKATLNPQKFAESIHSHKSLGLDDQKELTVTVFYANSGESGKYAYSSQPPEELAESGQFAQLSNKINAFDVFMENGRLFIVKELKDCCTTVDKQSCPNYGDELSDEIIAKYLFRKIVTNFKNVQECAVVHCEVAPQNVSISNEHSWDFCVFGASLQAVALIYSKNPVCYLEDEEKFKQKEKNSQMTCGDENELEERVINNKGVKFELHDEAEYPVTGREESNSEDEVNQTDTFNTKNLIEPLIITDEVMKRYPFDISKSSHACCRKPSKYKSDYVLQEKTDSEQSVLNEEGFCSLVRFLSDYINGDIKNGIGKEEHSENIPTVDPKSRLIEYMAEILEADEEANSFTATTDVSKVLEEKCERSWRKILF